jgi:hypothetical protein
MIFIIHGGLFVEVAVEEESLISIVSDSTAVNDSHDDGSDRGARTLLHSHMGSVDSKIINPAFNMFSSFEEQGIASILFDWGIPFLLVIWQIEALRDVRNLNEFLNAFCN